MSKLVPFGELREGDFIRGTQGPVRVGKAYDEHLPETMFHLEFEGGRSIDASGNHLWYVETSFDRSLHRKRVKTARKLFKDLHLDHVEELEVVARMGDFAETSLADMLALFDAEKPGEKQQAIIRVAESLGPTSEEATTFEDLYSGEEISMKALRLYDARLFAQQLLALHSKRFEREWPIIRGRVITTEGLALLASTVDIPEIRSFSSEN